MKTLFVGQNSIHLGSVDSTNSYASELLRQNSLLDGTIVVSYDQQKGKGQRGNQWLAEPDKNVAASIILYPSFLPAEQQFELNKIASLAVADLMAEMLAEKEEVSIKWPNDVFIGDKKAAGILIESSLRDGKIQHSIVGIGINVNQKAFEPGLNATSMAAEAGKEFVLTEIVDRLCAFLEARYLQLRAGKNTLIHADYLRRLYRIGEWHFYSAGEERLEGRILGIAVGGKLQLELRSGQVREFDLKEIRFL